MWRCLLKNAYAMQQKIGIVTAPKLGFETILHAMVLSSQGEETYEYDDLECIVVSLVSQVSRPPPYHEIHNSKQTLTFID